MNKPIDTGEMMTVLCQCGEAIKASPRFRFGGETPGLCWVCARLLHSVVLEAAIDHADMERCSEARA